MLSKSTWISSIVIRRNSRSSGLLVRLGIGVVVVTCLYSQGLADEMMVLQLDGKSGYVELPGGAFDRLESATVEAWIKWNRFNKWARVFDFGREGNATVVQTEKTSNGLNFRIWDRGGKQRGIKARKVVSTGAWYHIAAVSGYGGMQLYVNGNLVGDESYYGSLSESAGGNNLIGKSNWPEDKMLDGSISEFRVWSRPLSRNEITQRMNRTLTGAEEGLVGYWRFSEAEGGMVPNVVTGRSDARLVGGASLVSVPAIAPLLVPGQMEKTASQHLEKGKRAFENGSYGDAIRELRKYVEYIPGDSEAQALIAEGHYRLGVAQFGQGLYREAYDSFESAMIMVPGYKDSSVKQQEAYEKARYRVAVYPVKTSVFGANIGLFQQSLMSSLTKGKSKFVDYVDQATLNRLFQSQGVSISLVDPMATLNAAKSSDIRLAVLCDLLTASSSRTSPNRVGMTAEEVTQVGDNLLMSLGQRTYHIVTQSANANCEANFRVLDTSTGDVLVSETLSSRINDKVEYASYYGDYKRLAIRVKGKFHFISQSDSRFTARRDLENPTDMMNRALRDLAGQIASRVNSFTGSFSPNNQAEPWQGRNINLHLKVK